MKKSVALLAFLIILLACLAWSYEAKLSDMRDKINNLSTANGKLSTSVNYLNRELKESSETAAKLDLIIKQIDGSHKALVTIDKKIGK